MHQEVLHKGPLIDTLKLISCNGVFTADRGGYNMYTYVLAIL